MQQWLVAIRMRPHPDRDLRVDMVVGLGGGVSVGTYD
jgi:hypothetical protein